MVTIEEAEQSIAQAKAQVQEQRANVSDAQSKIQELRNRLPDVNSQRALRSRYAGLKGRNFRQAVNQSSEALNNQSQNAQAYLQELNQYEQEQINPVEQNIQEVKLRNEAIATAQQFYQDKVPLDLLNETDFENPYTYDYYKDLVKQNQNYQDSQTYYLENPQVVKEKVDILTAKGLTQDQAYGKLGLKLTKTYEEVPTQINDILSDMPRDIKVQDQIPTTPKFNAFAPMFPLASASAVDPRLIGEIQKSSYSKRLKDYASSKIKRVGDFLSIKFDNNNEIYSPLLSGFAQAGSSGQFDSSTQIIRSVTPLERYNIEQANVKGSFKGFVIEPYRKVEMKVNEFFMPDTELGKRFYAGRDATKGNASVEPFLKPFDFLAEKTLQAGEYLTTTKPRLQDKRVTLYSDSFLGDPSPISRETAKEIIKTSYIFAGFEPLMRTGTAQQTESVYTETIDPLTGRRIFIKKTDIKDLLGQPKVEGKNFNFNLDYLEKARRTKILIDNLKEKSTQNIDKILKVVEEQYGKQFIKDFKIQEGIGNNIRNSILTIGNAKPVRVSKPIVYTPTPSQYAGLGQYERTAATKSNIFSGEMFPVVSAKTTGTELKGISGLESGASVLDRTRQNDKNKIDILSNSKNDTILKIDNKQSSETLSLLGIKPKQNSDQFFDNKLDMGQRSNQEIAQRNIQLFSPDLKSEQMTKQDSKVRQDFFKQRTQKEKLKPKKTTNKIPFLERILKKVKTSKDEDNNLFSVKVRRFGEDKEIFKGSNKSKAESVLNKFLRGSLGRSGQLFQGDKPLDFKETSFSKNFMFRQGKKDKTRIVQKSEFSLGSFSERKEIQGFRKQKKKSKGSFNWWD